MLITSDNLKSLIETLLKDKHTVIAPVKEGNDSAYKPISSFSEVNLELPFPTKSTKEYFFSDSEPILEYSFPEKGKIAVTEPPEPQRTILFGMRPCEAVSYPIMDKVFTWDYNDEFYLKRRAKNTIITVACEKCDEFCFCTSVGISPETTEGTDIYLRKTVKGNYLVKPISDKGKALVDQYKTLFTDAEETPVECKSPAKKFDLTKIKPW
ncbi:MAG: heterodisulfide reductase subunit A, partial [Planctomycetota bacterium]